MHPNHYHETIKEALNTLIGVNDSIYNSIVNISMQWELKEFNDAVPIGETHQLDFEIFKHSSDTNIQLLIQLIGKEEETFDNLANINGIEIEEGE
ncbi:hypothetical protein [Sediminibacterium sp. C3]|uniref:hypothetical protein n=1 Tax=Sediminibacterium sp. C3 TaxID=1267211 RepID=UPI000428B832|nr:hypothetical protein [Sediminibacterium sp. C3]